MSRADEDGIGLSAERARIDVERAGFVGLSVEDASRLAERLNITLRVIDLDASGWHTPDIRHDRLTVDVQGGVVVSASVR